MNQANIQSKTLRIGHSPDPDDAFMWYPIAEFPNGSGPGGKTYAPCIDTRGYRFVHVLEDIQSLNQRSKHAELEITALSIHQYPFVADHYALTNCGSSMGDGYGPMIVTKGGIKSIADLKGKKLAIPGMQTTAWLTLQLLLAEHQMSAADIDAQVVMFDEIPDAVVSGRADAGLLIHEGQITYQQHGLELLVDLGAWWTGKYDLPLPLGGNAIRRDLAAEMPTICAVLLESIEYALAHRDESVAYALNYARDMGADLADEFVGMYVNQWTLDYGDRGREAVRLLLREGHKAGLVPDCGEIDFIMPGK